MEVWNRNSAKTRFITNLHFVENVVYLLKRNFNLDLNKRKSGIIFHVKVSKKIPVLFISGLFVLFLKWFRLSLRIFEWENMRMQFPSIELNVFLFPVGCYFTETFPYVFFNRRDYIYVVSSCLNFYPKKLFHFDFASFFIYFWEKWTLALNCLFLNISTSWYVGTTFWGYLFFLLDKCRGVKK